MPVLANLIIVNDGVPGRQHKNQVEVTAANNLSLGNSNSNTVNGNTQINLIDGTYWNNGDTVELYFSGTPTVKHGQATACANQTILLQGAVDLVAAANTVLGLVNDGTSWQEFSPTGRSRARRAKLSKNAHVTGVSSSSSIEP